MKKRVLFTSLAQPIGGCSPDIYSWNKVPSRVRLSMSFINHPGLGFLAANVPGVEILEYPTWADFCEALRDPPEVLGISFYINETAIALKMAAYARAQGTREVWAGNYGAYSPEVEAHFDRAITGWGEAKVAQALGVEPSDPLVHPPLYGCLGSNILPFSTLNGFLYTSRGCPYTCNYCQTPSFYGRSQVVPLESIDRVLHTYAKRGTLTINVLDENFGIFPAHTREVLRLFRKYAMRWIPLCRVDLLLKHFEEWREHGLFGVHLGVESLNQSSLSNANKRLDQENSIRVLRLLSKHNMIVQAFYMLGFEQDTEASIRDDIKRLAELDVDIVQVQIVTPYPRTPLTEEIRDRFGILDGDLSRYNSRNLVWNHPNLEPTQLEELQGWAHRTLHGSRRALRTLEKVLLYNATNRVTAQGLLHIGRGLAVQRLSRSEGIGVKSTSAWARRGWYAYEESGQPKTNPVSPPPEHATRPALRRRLPIASA